MPPPPKKKQGLDQCGLEKLTRLEKLELHDNRLSAVPEAVARLGAKLRVLRLERNQLTGATEKRGAPATTAAESRG